MEGRVMWGLGVMEGRVMRGVGGDVGEWEVMEGRWCGGWG